MNHVAIDLGSRESQVCVRNAEGTILREGKQLTKQLPVVMKTWERSRVIVETAAEAFRIADAAKAAGHEVRVVPSILAKQLGVGERSNKTDLRDARKLSEVSCRIDLPSVHVPSEATRELRALLRSRDTLIKTRTQLVNHVRGWMRGHLGRPRSGGLMTLPDRMRTAATQLKLELPAHVERVLAVVDALNFQLKTADTDVRSRAKASPVCKLFMTVPGVGPLTALGVMASIDDPTRFTSAHRMQSYLGLTPGQNSSSERQQHTGITKAGPSLVRAYLVQAAWTALRCYEHDPMVRWANQIASRRGKFIAVVALARKLAGILFALWRDQTSYQPTRAARSEVTAA